MPEIGDRITIAEYKKLIAKGKQGGRQVLHGAPNKPNKYRNKPVEVDGVRYDSKKEAAHIGYLKLLQSRGKITELETQVKFKFEGLKYDSGRTVQYWADARYKDSDGVVHVIDVKGGAANQRGGSTRTPAYKLKKALMRYWFSIEVEEV